MRSVTQRSSYLKWCMSSGPWLLDLFKLVGLASAETESKLEGVLSTFLLLRDERKVYECWRELVADHDVKGKQVHDTRLVAAMLRHDISHPLTFNGADFARYSEITVVEPQRAGELAQAE